MQLDFDVDAVLEDVISSAENAIDTKDHVWRTQYLTLGNQTRRNTYMEG